MNLPAAELREILDRHKNLWVGLIIIFILDRINWIDWIYCFLGFHLPAIASSSKAGGDETEK